MTDLKDLARREWQPIETAPRDGTHALFYAAGNPKADVMRARLPRIRVDHWSSEYRAFYRQLPEAPYSHWMRLPEPPLP